MSPTISMKYVFRTGVAAIQRPYARDGPGSAGPMFDGYFAPASSCQAHRRWSRRRGSFPSATHLLHSGRLGLRRRWCRGPRRRRAGSTSCCPPWGCGPGNGCRPVTVRGRRRRPIEAWGSACTDDALSPQNACASPTPAVATSGRCTMFAGIDTHKDTLAVAVIDPTGRQRAGREVPNTEAGVAQLVDLLNTYQVSRVGIEGAGGYGRSVAVHLSICWATERDVTVVEVPTLMTSRERRAQLGRGKTDPVDALAIARVTAREPHLPPVRLVVGPAADLRALLDYRDDLIVERTALVNRAHAELVGLRAGYQHQIPHLTNRSHVRAALTLIAADDSVRGQLCRRRLERVLAIDAETAQLKATIAILVADTGTTLTALHGVG